MSPQYTVHSTASISKKTVALIFFLPLAALLATAVTGTNDYLTLVVIAGLIFFTVLTDFKIALILIGLSSYFLAYAIWAFGLPGPLINLGYFLVIMLFLREFFFTSGAPFIRTPINYLLICLIAVGLLSATVGDSALYPSLKGLLRHVGFPLFFILLVLAQPDEKLLRKLVYAVILIAFVQVIASAIQFGWYSTVNPKTPGMRADYSGGLLGFSCGGYTAVLMAMTFSLFLGFILVKGLRWYLILGATTLLIPIYLASARAGVFLILAAALFMLLLAPLPRHAPLMKRLFVASLVVAFFLVLAYSGVGGSSFKALTNFKYIYDYSNKQSDSGMGRLQAFDVVSEQLANPLVAKLIGLGPGMLTPTSIVDNPNSLIAQNPVLFKHVTGFANTVIELGYVGLVLFLLLYIQVYRFNRRILRQIEDPFWESVSLGFCGLIFIYVISTFYVDSWIFYPLPFTFWALAAALWRVGQIRQIV